MSLTLYISAVALPLVGGLHRYAVNYGYRGQSREQSLRDAIQVGGFLACVSFIVVLLVW